MRFKAHTAHIMIFRIGFPLPVMDVVAGIKLDRFHIGITGHGEAGLITSQHREFLELTGGSENEVVVITGGAQFPNRREVRTDHLRGAEVIRRSFHGEQLAGRNKSRIGVGDLFGNELQRMPEDISGCLSVHVEIPVIGHVDRCGFICDRAVFNDHAVVFRDGKLCFCMNFTGISFFHIRGFADKSHAVPFRISRVIPNLGIPAMDAAMQMIRWGVCCK